MLSCFVSHVLMSHALRASYVHYRLAWKVSDKELITLKCNHEAYWVMFGQLPPEMSEEFDK